jgi:hypothetical protein
MYNFVKFSTFQFNFFIHQLFKTFFCHLVNVQFCQHFGSSISKNIFCHLVNVQFCQLLNYKLLKTFLSFSQVIILLIFFNSPTFYFLNGLFHQLFNSSSLYIIKFLIQVFVSSTFYFINFSFSRIFNLVNF